MSMRGSKQIIDRLGLTERQAQCVGRRLSGMTHLQIAHDMGLSVATVKAHVQAGYSKMGLNSQSDLVAYVAKRSGIDLRMLFDQLRQMKGSPQ